nr:hypothetical protein [Deltaproteobacteria bacterium]
IEGASRAIDNFCNRPDGFEAADNFTARFYSGTGRAFLLIDECVEISEVAVKDSVTDTAYTAWDTPTTMLAGDGDWIPFSGDRENPDFNSLPYDSLMVDPNGDESVFTSGDFTDPFARTTQRITSTGRMVPTVRVTAKWGYSINVPDSIKEACIMQASIWYKRLEGSMASNLANLELGELELFKTLDPAVELILRLGRYIRPATGRR